MNDAQLRALPFVEGQKDYPDTVVRQMFIRCGRKTKTFMLTLKHPRRRVTLGHYPAISLAKARELARDRLAEDRLSRHPAQTMTFEAARALYFKLHVPSMRPGSQRQVERVLFKRFKPVEKKKLADLTASQLAACIDPIASQSERHTAYLYCNSFLRWAYRREFLEANPLSRLKCPPAVPPRERVLSNAELISIWRCTAFHGAFGSYVRLLIVSAQRKSQWLNFKPEYIQGDVVTFPGMFMKSGKPHSIPLTPLMRSLIPEEFKHWDDIRKRRVIQKQTGTSGWHFHDLRRTTATKMADLGVPPHVIERLLSHAMPGVGARYNRASYMTEMRDALLLFEGWLMQLLAVCDVAGSAAAA